MTLPSKSPDREPNLLVIGVAATVVALVLAFGFLQLFGASSSETGEAPANTRAAPAATAAPRATATAPEAQAPAPPTDPPAAANPDSSAQSLPDLNLPAVSAADRFSIPRFGVDAPLTFRVVGEDAQLPDPDGPDDVAYYNFSAWPGYGGGPGVGGNAVFAGHVDSGFKACENGRVPPPCAAVLWDLNKLNLGDEIDVTVSGITYRYSVNSNGAYGDDADWASAFSSARDGTITVITCSGDFNPQTHNYDMRQVVTASLMP